MAYYKTTEEIEARMDQLVEWIGEWDKLSEDNDNNKHNLSDSQRQEWVDELNDLIFLKTL